MMTDEQRGKLVINTLNRYVDHCKDEGDNRQEVGCMLATLLEEGFHMLGRNFTKRQAVEIMIDMVKRMAEDAPGVTLTVVQSVGTSQARH